MDDLTHLQQLLASIKESADAIINLNAVVLNKIMLEGAEIYERFREEVNNDDISDDEIDEYFSKAMQLYIDDARKVKREIDEFVKSLLGNGEFNEEGFLYQVWSGDVYDNAKTEALVALNDDLVQQERNLTLDHIFDRATKLHLTL